MELSFEGDNVNLPDFMLVGAAKSGTTTLYRILAGHPELFFPPSEKEPFYFCFAGEEPRTLNEASKDRVVWQTPDYLELYRSAPSGALCGDASTSYLYKHDVVIPHMKKLYGERYKEVKIMVILRNPVDRAYSHYTYLVRNGFEELSFEEAIKPEIIESRKNERWGFDYLEYGSYAEQVEHYLSEFPDCRIFLMDDLKDKQKLINEITAYLGVAHLEVDKEFTANPSGIPKSRFLVDQLRKNKVMKWAVNQLSESVKHKVLNKRDQMMSKLLVKKPLDKQTRKELSRYFSDDVLKLEKLIGRSLEHWRPIDES